MTWRNAGLRRDLQQGGGFHGFTVGIRDYVDVGVGWWQSRWTGYNQTRREIMGLSPSDSRPCSSKWDESHSKCSGHCCNIDYRWKMSDSLSQISLLQPPPTQTPLIHTHHTPHTTALQKQDFKRVWRSLFKDESFFLLSRKSNVVQCHRHYFFRLKMN